MNLTPAQIVELYSLKELETLDSTTTSMAKLLISVYALHARSDNELSSIHPSPEHNPSMENPVERERNLRIHFFAQLQKLHNLNRISRLVGSRIIVATDVSEGLYPILFNNEFANPVQTAKGTLPWGGRNMLEYIMHNEFGRDPLSHLSIVNSQGRYSIDVIGPSELDFKPLVDLQVL